MANKGSAISEMKTPHTHSAMMMTFVGFNYLTSGEQTSYLELQIFSVLVCNKNQAYCHPNYSFRHPRSCSAATLATDVGYLGNFN